MLGQITKKTTFSLVSQLWKIEKYALTNLISRYSLTAMDVDRATESLPTTSKERPNFRRELYSR